MAILNKAKNLIINGALDYWQRGTSFTAVGYTADRFGVWKTGSMTHQVLQDTDVPSFSQVKTVLPFSLNLKLTTAQATLNATDYSHLLHKIEGNVLAPFAGRKLTLSFWVKATKIGTYCVAFRNANSTRSLVRKFTINTSNTWEKKVLTIQHDTTGTWNYGTGVGLDVSIVLASGSNFVAPVEDAWLDGNFISLAGQTNGVQSGAVDFKVAAIMLEEGEQPSFFERAGKNAIDELTLCQRYCEVASTASSGTASYTFSRWFMPYKVEKRVPPTVTLLSYAGGQNAGGVNINAGNAHGVWGYSNGGSINDWSAFYMRADAEL